jgi:hypothetical protein
MGIEVGTVINWIPLDALELEMVRGASRRRSSRRFDVDAKFVTRAQAGDCYFNHKLRHSRGDKLELAR